MLIQALRTVKNMTLQNLQSIIFVYQVNKNTILFCRSCSTIICMALSSHRVIPVNPLKMVVRRNHSLGEEEFKL